MISHYLIRQAHSLAQEISADALLIFADPITERPDLRKAVDALTLPTILIARMGKTVPQSSLPHLRWLTVPDVPMTRNGQVKLGLLICIARGLLKPGDRVICLSGLDRSASIDTMMVLDLDVESELVSIPANLSIPGHFKIEVFERTLALAASLAAQGREGHPLGLIFVVGDADGVLPYTQNLVLNPFHGYPENERNILDAKLEETVKEFAAIDGAFIIRGDGVILSAGARLMAAVDLPDLPKGLGTRHASAAGITKVTRAVALCVSQSTGNLTIFKDGRLVAEIAKPESSMALVQDHTALHPSTPP